MLFIPNSNSSSDIATSDMKPRLLSPLLGFVSRVLINKFEHGRRGEGCSIFKIHEIQQTRKIH